jgi:hypothetical protein
MKPLKHRLRLLTAWTTPSTWHDSLAINSSPLRSDATDFDRAHELLSICHKKGLLALSYYYADDPSRAKQHAAEFLADAHGYFFGDWRMRYCHPEGANPVLWMKKFDWMSVYELCILWGSATGDWNALSIISMFPEPESYVDFSHTAQDRDLFLAISAYCAGLPQSTILDAVRHAVSHRNMKCRLAASALGAIASRDDLAFRKAFRQLLAHHEAKDFLKVDMLCRISILGTFLYHTAIRAGMEADSAIACGDYIVRLQH